MRTGSSMKFWRATQIQLKYLVCSLNDLKVFTVSAGISTRFSGVIQDDLKPLAKSVSPNKAWCNHHCHYH